MIDLGAWRHTQDYGSHVYTEDQISSSSYEDQVSSSSYDDEASEEDEEYELCHRCGRPPKELALVANQLPCLCHLKKNGLSSGLSKCKAGSLKNVREMEKKRICERNSTKMDPCYFQVHSGVQVEMPDMNGLEEQQNACGFQSSGIGALRAKSTLQNFRS